MTATTIDNQPAHDFIKNDDLKKALKNWHRDLEDNRGERAALCRAHTSDEIVFSAEYQRLYRHTFAKFDLNREALPAVIGLLARVRQHDERNLGKALASPTEKKSQAAVSEARFRRLLRCEDQDDLFIDMRRVISLLDKKANLFELANLVYRWHTHWQRDKLRKDLAYSYYEFFKDKTNEST